MNLKLSEDRAAAVKNALIERGVNAENLESKGFGETQPVASNKTAAGKAQNRRTEIKHIGSKF
ncbi:putative lipoprotein YiaD precursor [compost metagenome]